MTDREANERLLKHLLALFPEKVDDLHELVVFFNTVKKVLAELDMPEGPDSDTH